MFIIPWQNLVNVELAGDSLLWNASDKVHNAAFPENLIAVSTTAPGYLGIQLKVHKQSHQMSVRTVTFIAYCNFSSCPSDISFQGHIHWPANLCQTVLYASYLMEHSYPFTGLALWNYALASVQCVLPDSFSLGDKAWKPQSHNSDIVQCWRCFSSCKFDFHSQSCNLTICHPTRTLHGTETGSEKWLLRGLEQLDYCDA